MPAFEDEYPTQEDIPQDQRHLYTQNPDTQTYQFNAEALHNLPSLQSAHDRLLNRTTQDQTRLGALNTEVERLRQEATDAAQALEAARQEWAAKTAADADGGDATKVQELLREQAESLNTKYTAEISQLKNQNDHLHSRVTAFEEERQQRANSAELTEAMTQAHIDPAFHDLLLDAHLTKFKRDDSGELYRIGPDGKSAVMADNKLGYESAVDYFRGFKDSKPGLYLQNNGSGGGDDAGGGGRPPLHGVRYREDLPTDQAQSDFIDQHGRAAYLKLPSRPAARA